MARLHRLRSRALLASIALAVCLIAPAAAAHGRFPAAGLIAVQPGDSERLLVRSTYGVLTSGDGGETWSWLCPEAIGFDGDKEDPAVVITGNGSVAMGTFDGLSNSTDGICDWNYVGGDLADRYFIDVQPVQTDTSALVALSSNGVPGGTFEVNLWQSSDDAASWQAMGGPLPDHFLALTLGLSAGDGERLYLTGRDSGASGVEEDLIGALYRSEDRGQAWERFDVPGTDDGTVPYIGGVDPSDPDRVFVANLRQEEGEVVYFGLLLTDDGGASWTVVYTADSAIGGFALSPDGKTVAIGGTEVGLLMADATAAPAEMTFKTVSSLRIGCITWDPAGLFVCADNFVDGFAVGVSQDDGQTFEPLMTLSSTCGPPAACGSDTSVGLECVPRWPAEQKELDAFSCESAAVGGGEGSTGACGCDVLPPSRSAAADAWGWRLFAGFVLLLGLSALRYRQRLTP